MMRRGGLALAFLASAGVHLAAAGAWPTRDVVVEGGDVAGEVALGNSFADLVAGTLKSTAADGAVLPARTVAETSPRRPEAVTPPATPASPVAATVSKTTPTAADQQTMPDVTDSVAVAAAVVASRPAMTVTTPTEARVPLAVQTSIRPAARPVRRAAQPALAPTPQEPVRRGNAEVSAASGQRTGSQTGTAAQSSGAQETSAQQVGQGEINDYASRVVSRITRVAERMRSRGTEGQVIVGLEIAANGGLARVVVAQSSGNPTADAIALDAARRAAPFDPTPTGRSLPVRFAVRLVSQ